MATSSADTRTVLVPVANGTEEVRALLILAHVPQNSPQLLNWWEPLPSCRQPGFGRTAALCPVLCCAFALVALRRSVTKVLPSPFRDAQMEAVIIIDVLRRAGASVTVASVEPGLEVTCSRGVKLVADALIGACEQRAFDLIACPVSTV